MTTRPPTTRPTADAPATSVGERVAGGVPPIHPAPNVSTARPGDAPAAGALEALKQVAADGPAGGGGPGNLALLRWMFSFLRPVLFELSLACLWLALMVGTEILAARQTAEAVDYIKVVASRVGDQPGGIVYAGVGFLRWVSGPTPEAAGLRNVVGLLVGLVAGMALLRYLREVANMKTSMKMVYGLREAVYDKLQHVGFRFHDAVSSGQLINRALTDLQNVRTFVQTAVLTSLEIALIVGGYIVLILSRQPWVALLALLPLPFWTWYILRFSRKVQPAARAVMEAQDRDVSILTENIAGVHVVKAFATQRQEIAKYQSNADGYYARTLERVRLSANFTPVMRVIAMGSNLTLFLATGLFIIYGRMSAGDFLILGTAMGSILGRLQQVSVINEQYQNAIVSARRLHEVLDARPTVPLAERPTPLPEGGRGAVTFEGVDFGYDASTEPGRSAAKLVLRDVSFAAPPASVVAIVGPTGAGKSTLVSLIGRFYDPRRGRVLIDGVDLRDADLAEVRRSVGFVFQETYLFSDTVEANIAYGRPGVTGGMVEAAARLAQAHEFICELPDGYQAVIGERGSSLSGGQRQRLAIARAILHDPRVLVLDDATAAIDPETEDLIRRGMKAVFADRTVFVIAHRISSVKRADLVLVLEGGEVTQRGTHAELMAREGHYREIATVQLYGDDVELDAEGLPMSHMDRVARDRRRDADRDAPRDDRPDEGEPDRV